MTIDKSPELPSCKFELRSEDKTFTYNITAERQQFWLYWHKRRLLRLSNRIGLWFLRHAPQYIAVELCNVRFQLE